jgi:hypothetical protein
MPLWSENTTDARKGQTVERYLVFSGKNYYPSGGWDDFHGDYASLEQAKAVVEELEKDDTVWAHIADLEVGKALHDIAPQV